MATDKPGGASQCNNEPFAHNSLSVRGPWPTGSKEGLPFRSAHVFEAISGEFPPEVRELKSHGASSTAHRSLIAVSSLGGFPTPAARERIAAIFCCGDKPWKIDDKKIAGY
jgi:hypothetical protein